MLKHRLALLCTLAALTAPAAPLRLLFSGPEDVTNTWGQLSFGTTPLRVLQTCENPGFEVSYCAPRDDDAWDVYGLTFKEVAKHND